MIRDMKGGVSQDLQRMDMVAMPLALLVLVIMLRSVKLMIMPILNVGVIFLISFSIMGPIANSINIVSLIFYEWILMIFASKFFFSVPIFMSYFALEWAFWSNFEFLKY